MGAGQQSDADAPGQSRLSKARIRRGRGCGKAFLHRYFCLQLALCLRAWTSRLALRWQHRRADCPDQSLSRDYCWSSARPGPSTRCLRAGIVWRRQCAGGCACRHRWWHRSQGSTRLVRRSPCLPGRRVQDRPVERPCLQEAVDERLLLSRVSCGGLRRLSDLGTCNI